MLSLHELQSRFADAMFDKTSDHLLDDQIRANGLSSSTRLGVYRNNIFVVLGNTLTSVYPALEKLIGRSSFRFAADHYIRQYPSISGDLTYYGEHFAEFLETFEPAAKLIHLHDLARLEWAYHRAYYAASHAPLDLQKLQTVAPEQYEQLKFRLHPSAHLIASEYPLLKIWQAHRADYEGEKSFDLNPNQDSVCLLIIRREDYGLGIEALEAGEFALLQALTDNIDFATACEQALQAQPDFDVAQGFQKQVMQGTLVDFSF